METSQDLKYDMALKERLSRESITQKQEKYIKELLARCGLEPAKPVSEFNRWDANVLISWIHQEKRNAWRERHYWSLIDWENSHRNFLSLVDMGGEHEAED